MEKPKNPKDSLSMTPSRYKTPAERATSRDATPSSSTSPNYSQEVNLSILSVGNDTSYFQSLEEEMTREKQRYPGASEWAPAEERLFEILYMRQDLPMLPSTWDVDLRGVPISDMIFKTSDEFRPIVYAHSKTFLATMSLTRLIDLTATVKTNIQSGLRKKAPALIKRELDKYLSWAAQDGGYAHLRIVPNVLTEVVDTTMKEDEITDCITNRMKSLARLQREFLKNDRDPDFWDVVRPNILTLPMVKPEPDDASPSLADLPLRTEKRSNPRLYEKDSSTMPSHHPTIKVEPGLKELRVLASPGPTNLDHLLQNYEYERQVRIDDYCRRKNDSPEQNATEKLTSPSSPASTSSSPAAPRTPNFPGSPTVEATAQPETSPEESYRRPPPVVYGFFILKTALLLLTVDSAKGEDAYVSYQVQVNFQEEQQGVWNALTVAIAACLARDELRARVEDFEDLPCVEDSDPDA